MKNLKAFTLVELLVCIAILAIMSGIILIVIDPAGKRARARDSIRRSDLAIVSSALEQYYADNAAYPNVNTLACLYEVLDGPPVSGSCGTVPVAKAYLKTKPNDPSIGSYSYCYRWDNSQSYTLCAKLEGSKTDEMHGVVNKCPATSPNTAATGFFCLTNPF